MATPPSKMSERDKEEEKTLEPNLGLLGGGWKAACREKGKHPAVNGSVDLSWLLQYKKAKT